MRVLFLDVPHHDGSSRYVPQQAPVLGETVPVFLDVPDACRVTDVWVRTTPDGEPAFARARLDRRTPYGTWWRGEVRVTASVTGYRFLLRTSDAYLWLTAAGPVGHDVPDHTDFRLVASPAPPDWAQDAVVYQIFPDRFARSAGAGTRELPGWAAPADWDDRVVPHGPLTPRQFYGGDLDGIRERLDHVGRLGANALYLTPFFPARSNHRYDAAAFDRVDPLLGGDEALARLSQEVHRRGWRLLGDITTNHCGDAHPWFSAARHDPDSPERDFFYFNPDVAAADADTGYASWFGVPSLPKFNHASTELRHRLLEGPGSVTGRWLRPPYGLDGWRVDVANMTGRYQVADHAHTVARVMRRTLADVRPDALLIGEHTHDASADLDGDGWHGTMNQAAFTRPVWSWLRHPELQLPYLGMPVDVPRRGADSMMATMRAFASGVPWRSFAHSWSMLGSHDTARIRTVAGGPSVVGVAAGLLFTLPGVPMVFAGDEIGLEGRLGEDSRRPMPWHRPEDWDTTTFDRYRSLAALRHTHPALRRGGLRWVYATADSVGYLREGDGERLFVVANRTGTVAPTLSAHALALGGEAECLYGDAKPLTPRPDGAVTPPGDGPGFWVWSL